MPVICLSLLLSLTANADLDGNAARELEPIISASDVQAQLVRYIGERITPLVLTGDAESQKERADTLRELLLAEVIYKGVPGDWYQGPLEVEWTDTIETGKGYNIRKLRYEAVPGLWIAAVLYEPEQLEDKAPAVLNVNGHVGPPGKGIQYEQIRCINLAKRGCLALHPEWLSFGELQGPDYGHNNLAWLDLCGVSGVSVFYQAMKRGLDVLMEHPSTDPDRVAMTGLSGGGWQTILLSALNQRIRVSVPNAGYITLDQRMENPGDIGDLEQSPVDMIAIADYGDLTAMLAPRPALLIYNIHDDCCFQAPRARKSVFELVTPVYEEFGAIGKFRFHENVDPGTHNYDLDNRLAFYAFLGEHFGLENPDEELPTEGEILAPEDLHVGLPEDNATFHTLATTAMAGLPHAPVADVAREKLEAWRAAKRERLAEVLWYAPIPSESVRFDSVDDSLKESQGLRVRQMRMNTPDWSIPCTILASNDKAKGTMLFVADESPAEQMDLLQAWREEGYRVAVLEPIFLGTCRPERAHQWAMMFQSVGERILGVQAAQINTAAALLNNQAGTPVRLVADGWNAGMAARCAAALQPDLFTSIEAANAPESLKQLIAEHRGYGEHFSLYCFGLLREFDVPELAALGP